MSTQGMLTALGSYENVRYIDSIIDEMESGYFYNSARLVDRVLRDARLFAVLNTRISGLLGQKIEFEPAKGPKQGEGRGNKIADEVEQDWPRMFSRAALVQLLTWGIMHNSGVAQIIEDADPWRLDVWHPWALGWDEDKRGYEICTRENSRLKLIANKDGTHSDENGGRWVLYTPYGYGNTNRGILRSLHRLYLERQWAHRDRARYSEIFGQPIRFGIAPANASTALRDEYAERLAPDGAESVIVGQQGEEGNRWDLKLIEASGTSTELFNAEIEQLDKEIATLVLGQHQSTDGQGGLSTRENAGETQFLNVLRGDHDTLVDTLHTQFLTPYCEFTYGAGALAPWPSWDIEPAEDMAKKATEFKTIVDGLVAAKAAGLPVNAREVLELYNVPLLTKAEEAALVAEVEAKKQAELEAMAAQKPNTDAPDAKSLAMLSLTQERLDRARARLDREMPHELDADVLTAALSDNPDDIRQIPDRHELFYMASVIAQERMSARGIKKYSWTTRKDMRVRHEHKMLDGKEFAFDAPPIVSEDGRRGHPGQFPNCRCKASPVFTG